MKQYFYYFFLILSISLTVAAAPKETSPFTLPAISNQNLLLGLDVQFTKTMSFIPTGSSQSAPNKNGDLAHRTIYSITSNTEGNVCRAYYTQYLNAKDPAYLDLIQQLDSDIATKEVKILAISGLWQSTDANLASDHLQATFNRTATVIHKAATLTISCNTQARTVSSTVSVLPNKEKIQSNLSLLEEMGIEFSKPSGQKLTAQQIATNEILKIERERARVLLELSKIRK